MRHLRTNTAVIITVGPFLGTDGLTPKTALTATNEHITLAADTDAGSAPTLVLDITGASSGTSNDLVHITGDDAGFYSLELAAADTNRLGRMILAITDATNHCPVFHEFMVLPAVIYDAMILGTDLFDVSMTQILGTAVSTPATAGILDANVKNINNVAAATPGAAGGVFIAGTNAATTVTTALTTTFTGNLTGSVASVTGAVGSVTGAVGSVTGAVGSVTGAVGGNVSGNVTGSVGALAAQAKADVNAEVVDVIRVDQIAELAQAAPAATPTVATALMLLYHALRNQITVTSSSMTISNDAGVVIAKKALTDDSTQYTEAEMVSGP